MANGMYSTPLMGTGIVANPMGFQRNATLMGTTMPTMPQVSTPMPPMPPMSTVTQTPQVSTSMPPMSTVTQTPQVSTVMPSSVAATNNGFGLSVIDRYATSQPLSAFYDVLTNAVDVSNIIPSQEFYAPNAPTPASVQNGAQRVTATNRNLVNVLDANELSSVDSTLSMFDIPLGIVQENQALNADIFLDGMSTTRRGISMTTETPLLVNNFFAGGQAQRIGLEVGRVNLPTNTFVGVASAPMPSLTYGSSYTLPTNRFYSRR